MKKIYGSLIVILELTFILNEGLSFAMETSTTTTTTTEKSVKIDDDDNVINNKTTTTTGKFIINSKPTTTTTIIINDGDKTTENVKIVTTTEYVTNSSRITTVKPEIMTSSSTTNRPNEKSKDYINNGNKTEPKIMEIMTKITDSTNEKEQNGGGGVYGPRIDGIEARFEPVKHAIPEKLKEKLDALSCDVPPLPSESTLWNGNETRDLSLPITVVIDKF
ncbi:hypothetical protein Phum_PHUM617340 [Pediculus humanus corporis]|uniref:Uncharacterized protein n=1 Tax=Pediculus humanus subsp. corporis TaxID=121224 RepID=E0W4D1_PEDHC|nr:uncharacterized protein Phum_PHUM617340 [Pediculus humanus corporis]EEB20487.1 hypothetical protein Phum_PHUM617340 [Pediculus humanus corporis]